ncbi:MAG: hypothetical protein ABIR81_03125 [Ginsengibacter sp.]
MRKLAIALGIIILLNTSCNNSNNNINITYSEDDQYYSMIANFAKNKTRSVEKYMDYKLGHSSNMSFTNASIDGRIALDDHTNFYIKKIPGHIKIKLDKNENSPEAYNRVKAMCLGIKKVVIN